MYSITGSFIITAKVGKIRKFVKKRMKSIVIYRIKNTDILVPYKTVRALCNHEDYLKYDTVQLNLRKNGKYQKGNIIITKHDIVK